MQMKTQQAFIHSYKTKLHDKYWATTGKARHFYMLRMREQATHGLSESQHTDHKAVIIAKSSDAGCYQRRGR